MKIDLLRLEEIKVNKKLVLFLFWILFYKVVLEIGYWTILANKVQYFDGDFNIWKYFLGTVWVIILFLNIKHEKRLVSSFLLNLQLVVAIIPITVIYALCNESTTYFFCLCFAFLLAEQMVKIQWKKEDQPIIKIERLPYLILLGSLLIVVGIMGYVVATKGMPSFTALNFRNVYELRGDDYFITNEYSNYIYKWTMSVFLPFILALSLIKRKYFFAIVCVAIAFGFYLYSGNKTNLFMIPLVIGAFVFANYKDVNYKFYGLLTLGLGVTVPLSLLANFYMPFSLFVRRTLVIPANLKFLYHDFFTDNPKLGLSGTLLGSKMGIEYPYERRIGYIISEEYFDLPSMNSNTGFLAEGFSRFGYVGIFIALILFALILILLDRMQRRSGYVFAVTMSIYPMFSLNDGQLIDSLIFGPMLVLLLIILLYHDDNSEEGKEIQWKRRVLPKISI